MTNFSFPLTLRFKIIALAPQVFVEDSRGQLLLYVKQKLLKLKEEVNVYRDKAQTDRAYRVNADRIIDFNADYAISNQSGQAIGAMKRQGMRSIWKARYEVDAAFSLDSSFVIEEENPWVKMLNGFVEEIPLIGALSGYFLHPVYLVKRKGEGVVMKLTKQPALWEGRFELTRVGTVTDQEKELLVLSVVMMLLLERSRG
jgi:uncharacterized protein YxjI